MWGGLLSDIEKEERSRRKEGGGEQNCKDLSQLVTHALVKRKKNLKKEAQQKIKNENPPRRTLRGGARDGWVGEGRKRSRQSVKVESEIRNECQGKSVHQVPLGGGGVNVRTVNINGKHFHQERCGRRGKQRSAPQRGPGTTRNSETFAQKSGALK